MGTIDFGRIYKTDLVYVAGCWQLCGNAHCCNFSRIKQKFRMLGGGVHAQELPLVPGEYEYLRDNGYLAQFGDHDHRVIDYRFGSRTLRISSVISRKPGCACNHATRPTVCRLYPILPVMDADGRLTSIDRLGIYDAMEELEGGERICKIDSIPVTEIAKLLDVCAILAADPAALFYLSAYKIAQDHVRARLVELKGERQVDYFSVFEMAMLRGRLVDHQALAADLERLALAIEARHGAHALASLTAAALA